nr:transposase [Amycolatopsis balhimycina]
MPRCDDGRIVLGIDVSNWLRPDANTSPERLFCHTYARGKGQAQMIPGWPYSFVAALEPGRASWTAILDPQRLGPDEGTAVAAPPAAHGHRRAHRGWALARGRSGDLDRR